MEQNIQQQLHTLSRLYKQNDKLYRSLANRFGLNDTSFWILYAITHTDGDCTQNDLCNDWFYPIQTINSSVSNLVKKGYLQLETIPRTRNRKRILLTELGRELVDCSVGKVDEIEENAFSYFTSEEREMYISLFERHIENLRMEVERVLGNIHIANRKE